MSLVEAAANVVIGDSTAIAISDNLAIGGIITLSRLRGFVLQRVFGHIR